MKKLLIILILGLLLPITAYADMGAPENLTYEVEITDPDGIPFYERKCDTNYNNCKLVKQGTVKKGTVFNVYYEEEMNGEDYTNVEYNNNYVYIKLADTTLISKELSLKDERVVKFNQAIEKKVLKSNVKMYSSPAKAFKVVGTIPKGEKIKITHSYGDSWFYIEYKDQKGWIDSFMGSVGELKKKKILLTEEKELIDEKGKTIATIPADTMIESYYGLDMWSQAYYVEYEGKEGYIDYYNIAIQSEKKLKLFADAKGHKSFKKSTTCDNYSKSCKGDIVIPKDTEIEGLYYYKSPTGVGNPSYYLVKYKNNNYWLTEALIPDEGTTFFDINYIGTIENKTINVKYPTELFSDIDDLYNHLYGEESSIIGTAIHEGEEVKIIYSLYGIHYVEIADGVKGWISYHNYDSINPEEEPNNEEENVEEEIEIKEKGLSKKELILICIGGAIVLALTSIVIIIIIIKKRKIQNQ